MQPITYFHEPCGCFREGIREASVVVRMAGAIEHRNVRYLGRRDCPDGRRQHTKSRNGEGSCGPTVSKNSGTYVRILPGPGMPLLCPERIGTAWGRLKRLKPTMNAIEESDEAIVAMKAANKGGTCGAAGAKGLTRGEAGRTEHTPYTEMEEVCSIGTTSYGIRCRHARRCDPREEPDALTRTSGSVRGARGNPGPYRDCFFPPAGPSFIRDGGAAVYRDFIHWEHFITFFISLHETK